MKISYQSLFAGIDRLLVLKEQNHELGGYVIHRHLETLRDLRKKILENVQKKRSYLSWQIFFESHGLANKLSLSLFAAAFIYIVLSIIFPNNLFRIEPYLVVTTVLTVSFFIRRHELNVSTRRNDRLRILKRLASEYTLKNEPCHILENELSEYQAFSGDPELWDELMQATQPK